MKPGYKTLYERRKITSAMLRMAGYKNYQPGAWRRYGRLTIHTDALEERFYTNILPSKQTATLITQLNKVIHNETI